MTDAQELHQLVRYIERVTASMAHNHSVRTFIVDREAWYDLRKQVLRALDKAETVANAR